MVPASNLSGCFTLSSATRCPETGAFRFVFDVAGAEVHADLTVALLEEKGLAWLRFITVDRIVAVEPSSSSLSEGGRARVPGQVRTGSYSRRSIERALEAWVREHEREVFAAALRAS